MGIKNVVLKAANKAGAAVAKVSSLSPEQLAEVEKRREEYLAQMPDPQDAEAVELTSRLLAAAGVEIENSYLAQLHDLYAPADPAVEYEDGFDVAHNVRTLDVTRWVVDPQENSLEKLVNVYDVLADENCNIALVFNRTRSTTNVYLAVVDTTNSADNVDVESMRARLVGALRGNFPGSQVSDGGEVPDCLLNDEPYSVATVSNVPAEKSEKFLSQTIEKVLDGIVPTKHDEDYTIVLLATPVRDVEERKLRLAELYTGLAPYASWQTNFTFNQSDALGSSATLNVNVGVSAGVQNGANSSVTQSDSKSDSENQNVTDNTSRQEARNESESKSATAGVNASITAGVESSQSATVSAGFGGTGVSGSAGVTQSISGTVGTSLSGTRGKTTGTSVAETVGKSVARGLGKAVTKGVSVAEGVSKGVNLGGNLGAGFARSSNVTATIGANEGITQTFKNYAIEHALKVLESQMKRLDQASALGMWDFAAYVLSNDHNVANNVAHSYLALTQGEESYMSKAAVNIWRGDVSGGDDAATICAYLRELRHPVFVLKPALLAAAPTFSVYPTAVTAATALSGKELAYSLNFPRKSVPGLPVLECASFGRSVSRFDGAPADEGLKLGKIFHMHREEPVSVRLSTDSLAAHVFVTGSTGAGKTNTVCRMLDQASDAGVKFLVIEPAKGEYKDVYGCREDVSVYGTNPSYAPLLRINPFSFPQGVHVLEHLDRLVEVFNVCWPMYAAMPAVLKDAVERSYEDCGWDLAESVNPYGEGLYPTFADVARNVRVILDTSDYDAENKGAYKGSLLTRLQSLTNGINGMVLTSDELGDEALFDQNVIVDLSRVGSAETKSLLMGLLVVKLQEYRMAASEGMNLPLRHLTVLEEAHNLLKRTSTEQGAEGGNLLGKSVEMLSNAIAEMRTYGEGFVIADQAPGLLDMAAIRNTNTKVIMRLPDLSDRELVGRAANLNDAQIAELARLPRGVAAVYQNDWIEPVLCKVAKAEDGEKYRYERLPAAPTPFDAGAALGVAAVLVGSNGVAGDAELGEIKAALERLDLAASMRVAILRAVENPPAEPRMTKLAPLLSVLFPRVREACVAAVERTGDVAEWTVAAEDALRVLLNGQQVGDLVRRAAVQGAITDYVLNERRDEAAFKDWYERGGLR